MSKDSRVVEHPTFEMVSNYEVNIRTLRTVRVWDSETKSMVKTYPEGCALIGREEEPA